MPANVAWEWSHGDYEWRNVMFDDQYEVVAIFDFDEAGCYSVGREVFRCRELSFRPGAPEAPDIPGGIRDHQPHHAGGRP